MKTNAIVRIILFSLVIAILLSILIGGMVNNLYFSNGMLRRNDTPVPTESARVVNQHEITTQVQNIEIEWVVGSITIHQSDSLSRIIVEEFSPAESEYEMVCHRSGQTLKIQFCKESMKFPSFGINSEVSKDLVIRVPKNWNCNNLEIDTAASDVNIQDLTIHELDFDGASGNLILDNCNIEDLDIDTASGDVEFTGTLQNLNFDAASAKFYGEFFESPRSLNMDSMSGDMEIILPEDTGFELQLNTVSGSFDTDFSVGNHDNTYICGEGECLIKVSAMSGDVNILKESI